MNKYYIEKDKYLNKYVVWEKHRNYKVMLYSGYKYECKEWVKNNENRKITKKCN